MQDFSPLGGSKVSFSACFKQKLHAAGADRAILGAYGKPCEMHGHLRLNVIITAFCHCDVAGAFEDAQAGQTLRRTCRIYTAFPRCEVACVPLEHLS